MEQSKRVIKSHDDSCRKPKLFGPDKFPAVLKLPYLGNVSRLFEKKVQELTQLTYNQVKPRVILVSKPVLILELKDPKFHYYKSCIIYKFSCFCKRICIGQTTRHLKTRVNEHIPKYILKFIKEKTKNKTKAIEMLQKDLR